jgi:hypothetical protein
VSITVKSGHYLVIWSATYYIINKKDNLQSVEFNTFVCRKRIKIRKGTWAIVMVFFRTPSSDRANTILTMKYYPEKLNDSRILLSWQFLRLQLNNDRPICILRNITPRNSP